MDLDTYLASREQKWRDHQAAVEGLLGIQSKSKWMEYLGKQMKVGLEAGFEAPGLATSMQKALGGFERAAANLALPMGAGGGGSVSNTTQNTKNYNLSADFSNSNLYPSIADQFRLMEFTSE